MARGGKNNPTGKGGFADNPQNRTTNGRWSKETSISYWQNYFIRLSDKEFKQWNKKDKTMAQTIAWNNVFKSTEDLSHQKELSDRTEGKPQAFTDVTSAGEKIQTPIIYQIPDKKTQDDLDALSQV